MTLIRPYCAAALIITASTTALQAQQEGIVPPTAHTLLLKEGTAKQMQARLQKSGELIELPFVDDFSGDRFPGNTEGNTPLWTSRNATRNLTWAKNPPTIGVVSFDGADATGYPYQWGQGSGWADTLTSRPINLEGTASDLIGLSFYFQPKGWANLPPTAGADSLVLEFYAPELEQWFWRWSTVDISNTETFTFVYIPITQERFLKPGFQFRFRNIANLQGAFDLWHVDYIWLDRNGVNSTPVVDDVTFVHPLPSVLNNYTAIPLPHYAVNPAQHMVSNVSLEHRNLGGGPRTLEGNRIRIFANGNLTETYLNENSPAISGGSLLNYNHSFGALPNQIVLDPNAHPFQIDYTVEFSHGVSDFGPTATNDTMRVRHRFFTHYAYDDGSAEAGYFVSGTGSEAAIRYTSFASDSIWALEIYTMPSGTNYESTPITIRIYEDTGNGPGAPIAEALRQVVYGRDEFQEKIIYTFNEPVFVPSGTFFVGYRQANQSNSLIIGLDFNTNANQGRLFFRQGPSWTASSVPGSIMIRPMFTTPGYQIIAGARTIPFAERLRLYPNPTRDLLYIDHPFGTEPLAARIFDLSGRLVKSAYTTQAGTLNISDLQPGAYVVQLGHHSGAAAAKKLIVQR